MEDQTKTKTQEIGREWTLGDHDHNLKENSKKKKIMRDSGNGLQLRQLTWVGRSFPLFYCSTYQLKNPKIVDKNQLKILFAIYL